MATNFCLPPSEAEKFKRAVISGEISPEKLITMSSSERRQFFGERFGKEAAPDMNRLFEERLLHKNQQQAMISWAQRMMAGEKYAPQRKDLIARIQGMKEVLTPENEDAFLEELASYKLGTRVSFEEAKNIADLSAKVEEAKAAMEAGGDRMAYGRAVVDLRNYVSELTAAADKLDIGDFKTIPWDATKHAARLTFDNSKAILASLDDSALFRQGYKALLTHPKIWRRNALQSFKDIWNTFGGKNVLDAVDAEIISRPTYAKMVRAGVALGTEDIFPTSMPEKIPYLGRAFKASENAFGGFQRRNRADLFDKYLQIAEAAGVDTNNQQRLKAIGKLVNSLTGRAHLGKAEAVAGGLNTIFFSPRMVMSHIDVLAHALGRRGMDDFTRKEAAKNLAKILFGMSAILLIAKALKPDSVDLNPLSTDFGKIKVGNARFDVTGGQGNNVRFLAREIMGKMKQSDGKIVDHMFGESVRWGEIEKFFRNKLAPVPAAVVDVLRDKTFEGKKPTVAGEIEKVALPIPAQNLIEMKDSSNKADALAAMIADGLGISTQDYGSKKQ